MRRVRPVDRAKCRVLRAAMRRVLQEVIVGAGTLTLSTEFAAADLARGAHGAFGHTSFEWNHSMRLFNRGVEPDDMAPQRRFISAQSQKRWPAN